MFLCEEFPRNPWNLSHHKYFKESTGVVRYAFQIAYHEKTVSFVLLCKRVTIVSFVLNNIFLYSWTLLDGECHSTFPYISLHCYYIKVKCKLVWNLDRNALCTWIYFVFSIPIKHILLPNNSLELVSLGFRLGSRSYKEII